MEIMQPSQNAVQNAIYHRARYWLLLPSWLVLGFVVLMPVALMLVYSFLTKDNNGGVIWKPSLDGYAQLFINRGIFGDGPAQVEWTYIGIYWRSAWQAALATFFCLILGFPTAYFIATRPESTRQMWVFIITVPYWVNLLIRTVSVQFLLRGSGPLNEVLLATGTISTPLRITYTDFAVQVGLFYSYLPFMVLPIYAALERYNFSLSEAAADLYASKWKVLRRIVIPSVKPGIVAGCILVFVPSLGSFLAPDLLGGATNFMVGSVIDQQFRGSAGNWPFGAAVSMLLLSIVLIALSIYARQQARAAQAN